MRSVVEVAAAAPRSRPRARRASSRPTRARRASFRRRRRARATALGTVRLHSSERRVNLLFGHALFVSLQVFDVLPFSLAARGPTRRLMREGACSRRAQGVATRTCSSDICLRAALCVRPRAGGRAPGRTRRAWSGTYVPTRARRARRAHLLLQRHLLLGTLVDALFAPGLRHALVQSRANAHKKAGRAPAAPPSCPPR